MGNFPLPLAAIPLLRTGIIFALDDNYQLGTESSAGGRGNPLPMGNRPRKTGQWVSPMSPTYTDRLRRRFRVEIHLGQMSNANPHIARNVEIASKIRGMPYAGRSDHGPRGAAFLQILSCSPRKAWELYRAASGASNMPKTVLTIRLKCRLFAALNNGAPGAARRRRSGHMARTGKSKGPRRACNAQKQGVGRYNP